VVNAPAPKGEEVVNKKYLIKQNTSKASPLGEVGGAII
jgi:hypothetical protein